MPKVRKEIPELEKLVQVGRKNFVRYEEGAQLYSMGLHTFQELAKDAKAVYHVKRVVLVNTEIVNEYRITKNVFEKDVEEIFVNLKEYNLSKLEYSEVVPLGIFKEDKDGKNRQG